MAEATILDTWCTTCGEGAPQNQQIVHQNCANPNQDDIHAGPDCLAGKHSACRGEAWCRIEDEATKCVCCLLHDEWLFEGGVSRG